MNPFPWILLFSKLADLIFAIFGWKRRQDHAKVLANAQEIAERAKTEAVADADLGRAHSDLITSIGKLSEASSIMHDDSQKRKEIEDELEKSSNTLVDLYALLNRVQPPTQDPNSQDPR